MEGGSEHPPPPLPKRSALTNLSDGDGNRPVPVRRAPPAPGRPPPPARPTSMPPKPVRSSTSSKPLPPPPSGESRSTGQRRKLEITVIGAKPMSEVGFRDLKGGSGGAVGAVMPKSAKQDQRAKPVVPPSVGKKGPPPAYQDIYAVPDKAKKSSGPAVTDDLLDLSSPTLPPHKGELGKPKANTPSSDEDCPPPPVPQRTSASGFTKPPEEDLLIDFDAPDPVVPKPVNKPTIILPGRVNSAPLSANGNESVPPKKVGPSIILPPKPKATIQASSVNTELVNSVNKPLLAAKPRPPVASKPSVVKPKSGAVSSSSDESPVEQWSPMTVPTIIAIPKKNPKPTMISPEMHNREDRGEFDNPGYDDAPAQANSTSRPPPTIIKPSSSLPPSPCKADKPLPPKPKASIKANLEKKNVQKQAAPTDVLTSNSKTPTVGMLIDLGDFSAAVEETKPVKPVPVAKKAPPVRPPSFKEKTPPPAKPSAPPNIKPAELSGAKPTSLSPAKTSAPLSKLKKTKPPKPPLPKRPGPGHVLYHYVVEGPHGIALYDYEPANSDELAFKASDVIVLIKRVNADWLLGRNVDREGMFPQNFIDIVQPLPDNSPSQVDFVAPQTKEDTGTGPRCRARFDFEGGEPDDLIFQDGDVIKLLDRVGDDWMKGEFNGQTGNFPLAFVEIIEDLPVVVPQGASDNHAVAIYDFDGHAGELSFKTGDTITVLGKVSDDWLYGELHDGQKGNFPIGFINAVPATLHQLTPTDNLLNTGKDSKQACTPHCIAQYDFGGESEGDLAFSVGDRITITSHVGQDWLVGILHGKEGLFPKAFVDIIQDITDDSDIASSSTARGRPCCKAMYDFVGETEQELSFKTGDDIFLLSQISEDWLMGELNGKTGQFPAGFVQVLVPL